MNRMLSTSAKLFLVLSLFLFAANGCATETPEADRSRFSIDHIFQLGDVSDPRMSPDGKWISYTVTRPDLEEDESRSQVWMIGTSGGKAMPLTAESESSWHARWSPDGRYLTFLSAREEKPAQVWSLYRGGGEAVELTDTAQAVQEYEWSPDASKLLLVLKDPSPEEIAKKEQGDDYEEETPPPWVIDREQFKTDYVGYLDRRRTHIYVLDAATGEITQLTSGDYDDSEATWSPDGRLIAFTSNRSDDPDSNYNTDIWTVEALGNGDGKRVQVTNNPGPDAQPDWSPDGKYIAHTSVTDSDAMLYATSHLSVSSVKGGKSRVLTNDLDRMVFNPRFSSDNKSVWFLLEDGGEQNLARIDLNGESLDRVVSGENVVSSFAFVQDDVIALTLSRPQLPTEMFTLSAGELQQRSFTNRNVLEGLEFGTVEKIRFSSEDGTPIETFVIKPPNFKEGNRYPVVLDIHGGPQAQHDFSFNTAGQLHAALGYLVVLPNPRGSTGYGQAFCAAIWQDWGGPDFDDVMGAVDSVIERGWGDPERLAVSGWSYGGILTNHVITKTDRFKAAVSGASATLYVVNYGHDMYQRWWDQELGLPWEPEARERYEKISPFNNLDKVTTPTLVLGGEKDWNVPIINSEQLYIALKKLDVETQLVVYPGEYHGGFSPSHEKDLYNRYIDWFGKHLGSDQN